MEKIKRKPAKIKKKKASSYQILDPLISPQHRIKDDFNYNDLPKDVTNDQVLALQEKNFALWVCTSGLKVDHNDFSFDDHKYMIPLYMDTSKEIILQKAAQMGATIYELTELLHFAMFNEAVKTCLFFPTGDGIIKLSRDRMTPLLASNKQLSEAVEDTDTLGYKKIGKSSALYLQHLGGIASKDSTPFDMISFDEVRLLKAADIDQARERISHSTHKIVRMVSTAGMPNGDINRQFLRGTQNYWHTRCFPMEQTIIVRKKGDFVPLPISLKQLEDSWDGYEALSWNIHHKLWQYKPITNFFNNGKKEIIEARFRNGAKLKVTPDHEFFTHTGLKHSRTKKIAIKDIHIAENNTENAHHTGHVLVARRIPEPGCSRGFQQTNSISQSPWDNLTLFLVGAYLAEGSWRNDTWIDITQSKKTEIRKLSVEWANQNNLLYEVLDDRVSIGLTSRKDLIKLFKSLGKGCANKQLSIELLESSNKQLRIILDAYLRGDGTFRKDSTDYRGFKINTDWSCTTTSETLKNQLIFIGLRIGTPVHQCKNKKREDRKQTWTLTCNSKSHFNKHRIGDKDRSKYNSMSNVSLKSRSDVGEAVVGCIEVADNHNFVLADSGLLVQNCGCRDGIELSSVFPQCIVEHKNETYYRCPRCDYRINDPQNGEFISHKPGASVQSYHIHQMLSKFMTPAEILESFRTTQNIKEFWNAKLGRAYVDEENVPLTQDDLDAAVNTDCSWGKDEGQIAMGVDQMGGDNYIVISKRLRDGEKRIIHLEIIDDENPRYYKNGKQDSSMIFKRTAELMTEFKVDLCICDALPNYNDAKEFAQAFPKKVFLAYYIEQQRDMVQWGDRGQFKQQVKKGSHKIKFKQTVCLSRYLSIEFAMKEISNGNFQWPHPRTLVQIAKIEGKLQPTMLMEEVFYEHCKGIVRNKEIVDEATGAFKMSWVNLGGDPHFVHALNYNNIALERLKSVPIFCIG
jgi:hypothetical protein